MNDKMTLEDAKKEIEADCADNSWMNKDQRKSLDRFTAGRLHQNETCLAILAKVETPEPDEEGRAVLWLIDEGCSVGKEDGRYQVFSKPTPSGMRHFLGEHPVTEAKKLGWGG